MREYLKELRMERGENQQTVAKALNIAQNYYSQIENGIKQKNIDLMLLVKLSDHFGVPLQDLINREIKYKDKESRKGA